MVLHMASKHDESDPEETNLEKENASDNGKGTPPLSPHSSYYLGSFDNPGMSPPSLNEDDIKSKDEAWFHWWNDQEARTTLWWLLQLGESRFYGDGIDHKCHKPKTIQQHLTCNNSQRCLARFGGAICSSKCTKGASIVEESMLPAKGGWCHRNRILHKILRLAWGAKRAATSTRMHLWSFNTINVERGGAECTSLPWRIREWAIWACQSNHLKHWSSAFP